MTAFLYIPAYQWAWLLLWLVTWVIIPDKKLQRGYVWRVLRKIPPWRWLKGQAPPPSIVPWSRMVILSWIVWQAFDPFTSERIGVSLHYLVLIALNMDDYYNGDDDDRKRRYEWARNKIRWLMKLPAPPQEVKDVA